MSKSLTELKIIRLVPCKGLIQHSLYGSLEIIRDEFLDKGTPHDFFRTVPNQTHRTLSIKTKGNKGDMSGRIREDGLNVNVVVAGLTLFHTFTFPSASTPKIGALAVSIRRVYSRSCAKRPVISCPMPLEKQRYSE
jgi:hypothetical protein